MRQSSTSQTPLTFHHSIIPSFHHSIITSLHHYIIPSLHHYIIPSIHSIPRYTPFKWRCSKHVTHISNDVDIPSRNTIIEWQAPPKQAKKPLQNAEHQFLKLRFLDLDFTSNGCILISILSFLNSTWILKISDCFFLLIDAFWC